MNIALTKAEAITEVLGSPAPPRTEFFTKNLLFMSDYIFKRLSRSFIKYRLKITKKIDFIKLVYSKLMGVWGIYILSEECIVVLNHAQREAISEGIEHIEASI